MGPVILGMLIGRGRLSARKIRAYPHLDSLLPCLQGYVFTFRGLGLRLPGGREQKVKTGEQNTKQLSHLHWRQMLLGGSWHPIPYVIPISMLFFYVLFLLILNASYIPYTTE